MGDYEWGRDNGLWGEDGIPYDLADKLEYDDLEINDFEEGSLESKGNGIIYSKDNFPGMRDSGSVKNTERYTIAEYEDKGFRLESIALNIQNHIKEHFVLYDLKGGIYSDNANAIRVIKGLYGSSVEIEYDQLMVIDTLLSIKLSHDNVNERSSMESSPSSLNDNVSSGNFWHMQLHPLDLEWKKEKELLETHSIIGIGKDKSDPAFKNLKQMKIGDIVVIRRGATPIALVKVKGEIYEIDANKDENIHLDWFKYRREVNVLQYASIDMKNFPSTRGTLVFAKNKNSPSYNYISSWLNRVPSKSRNPVNIPIEISISSASPSFGVESISKALASIITRTPDKNGMMVGIFGKWGRGKTYLFNKIWEAIEVEGNNNYRVNFSAWKYQETKESWAYLYESMIEQYLQDSEESNLVKRKLRQYIKLFNLNFNKYQIAPIAIFSVCILVSIYLSIFGGSIILLKSLLGTLGIITSAKIFLMYLSYKNKATNIVKKYTDRQSYSEYLGMQAEIESEIEILVKTWIPKSKDGKILLFVDDIDRCETSKIVKLIDGLRIILDNPEIHERLIVITAIDEGILKESVEDKYPNLTVKSKEDLFQEYLEKIFIIGIKLNSLEHDEVKEYLSKLIPKRIKNDPTINDNEFFRDRTTINPLQKNETVSNSLKTSAVFVDNDLDKSIIENVEDNYELSEKEEAALINSITRLENPTPRKIKIFYYKYLILKQIFHVRLLNKELVNTWDFSSDEKLIIDMLIHVSNHKTSEGFNNHRVEDSVMVELKYSANMLSIL
ncbi:hypothetical protein BCV33_12005 [Vibrio lentus]|uniref:KAP family P-loop NTPase fold protein n=1 Tax=Vibrio lentus TaxID=136468 RepID=UPI000C86271B|nr:P-loop NTPase fold protein [Vibrio lentus]PME57466.1 hypothetical protein BCV33_12005 [Vibrio lentus]